MEHLTVRDEDHMVAIVPKSKTEVRDRRDQLQDLTLMSMMFWTEEINQGIILIWPHWPQVDSSDLRWPKVIFITGIRNDSSNNYGVKITNTMVIFRMNFVLDRLMIRCKIPKNGQLSNSLTRIKCFFNLLFYLIFLCDNFWWLIQF